MVARMLPYLGVQCSTAGGLWKAFTEAQQLGIDTFQVATRNLRQWQLHTCSEEEIAAFRAARRQYPVRAIVSHACYLINLTSDNPVTRERSIAALRAELERCHQLHIDYVVFHPGSSKRPFEHTVDLFADAIAQVFADLPAESLHPKLLIENTAGQGNAIGWSLEQLAALLETLPAHLGGFCLDTCHLFAAGYDLRRNYREFYHQLHALLPVDRLLVWHFNDSRYPCGSRRDRHAHIGQGFIGITPFLRILEDFPTIPKILETPKRHNMDPVNLERLRSYAGASSLRHQSPTRV